MNILKLATFTSLLITSPLALASTCNGKGAITFGIFVVVIIGVAVIVANWITPGTHDDDDNYTELQRHEYDTKLRITSNTKKPLSAGVEGETCFVSDSELGTLRYVFRNGEWKFDGKI